MLYSTADTFPMAAVAQSTLMSNVLSNSDDAVDLSTYVRGYSQEQGQTIHIDRALMRAGTNMSFAPHAFRDQAP